MAEEEKKEKEEKSGGLTTDVVKTAFAGAVMAEEEERREIGRISLAAKLSPKSCNQASPGLQDFGVLRFYVRTHLF